MFILSILSGLALFLFSITQISSLLKSCVTDSVKLKISKYADNPFLSLLAGTVLTGTIQSSSGTTAIIISLIRADIVTFKQSIGFIMGANLGTTVTAFITGIEIKGLAPLCLILGIVFYMVKKDSKLALGIFYFGLLFFGITLMESELVKILEFPQIQGLILLMSQHKLFSFIFGILLTTCIQSSSAFVALIQQLCFLNIINLPIALFMITGSNVGTTITAYIASLGGSKESKMAAMYHFLFNLIGAVVFIIFYIPIYNYILTFIVPIKMQLAIFHALFNLVSIVAIMPFNNMISKCIEKMFHYSSFS